MNDDIIVRSIGYFMEWLLLMACPMGLGLLALKIGSK